MKLEEGEIICPVCNGDGLDKPTYIAFPWCTKCKGHGKLDWVEMVVGKNSGSYIFWIKPIKAIEIITVNITIGEKKKWSRLKKVKQFVQNVMEQVEV